MLGIPSQRGQRELVSVIWGNPRRCSPVSMNTLEQDSSDTCLFDIARLELEYRRIQAIRDQSRSPPSGSCEQRAASFCGFFKYRQEWPQRRAGSRWGHLRTPSTNVAGASTSRSYSGLQEATQPGASAAEMARRYRIDQRVLGRWKKEPAAVTAPTFCRPLRSLPLRRPWLYSASLPVSTGCEARARPVMRDCYSSRFSSGLSCNTVLSSEVLTSICPL
jgi:hypothetical protein